eukprot:s3202_g3.t1
MAMLHSNVNKFQNSVPCDLIQSYRPTVLGQPQRSFLRTWGVSGATGVVPKRLESRTVKPPSLRVSSGLIPERSVQCFVIQDSSRQVFISTQTTDWNWCTNRL